MAKSTPANKLLEEKKKEMEAERREGGRNVKEERERGRPRGRERGLKNESYRKVGADWKKKGEKC